MIAPTKTKSGSEEHPAMPESDEKVGFAENATGQPALSDRTGYVSTISKRRRVQFSESPTRLENVSYYTHDGDGDDAAKRWYGMDEMRGFFAENLDSIASHRSGDVGKEERDMRGLEHLTERVPDEVRVRVRLAVNAVLREQDRQRREQNGDGERIRAAAAAMSEFAAGSAMRFGAAVATETRRGELVRRRASRAVMKEGPADQGLPLFMNTNVRIDVAGEDTCLKRVPIACV